MCIRDSAKANEGWAKLQQIVEDYKKDNNGASVYAPSFIEDCEPAVKKLQEEYGFESVSYTHLDVYKRQLGLCPFMVDDVLKHCGNSGFRLCKIRVLINYKYDPLLFGESCQFVQCCIVGCKFRR